METGAVEGMNESYEALQQVQSVRAQLKQRTAKAGKGGIADAIGAVERQAAELEGGAQAVFFGLPPSGKQPENLSTLNQHFGAILAVADSADASPTSQAAAVYRELEGALDQLLSRWKKIRESDIPALNASLKKAALPEIDPHKALGEPPSADAGGDDEP
jgi:hypothetical protein